MVGHSAGARVSAGALPATYTHRTRVMSTVTHLNPEHSHAPLAISLVLMRRSFELVGRTAVGERDGGEVCGERDQVQT
jgi:hypothetical protein